MELGDVIHPDGLDPADFLKIARRIKGLASDIAVYIVADVPQPPTKLQLLAQRRTLVFAPHPLRYFKPCAGQFMFAAIYELLHDHQCIGSLSPHSCSLSLVSGLEISLPGAPRAGRRTV